MNNTIYQLIKTERARKTGEGSITYAVLKNAATQGIYFTLLANDGAGQFSNEIVGFDKIEKCLAKVDAKQPVTAKIFAAAYQSRSVNNFGFLLAALRQESLLAPTVDASHLHAVTGNWDDWKRQILAQEGSPYKLPTPKGKGGFTSAAPADTQAKPDAVVHQVPIAQAESIEPKGKKTRKLLRLAQTPSEATLEETDEASAQKEDAHHDDAA